MSECRNQCGKGRQKDHIKKKKAESQQRSSLASDELTFRGRVSVASVPALTLYLHSEKTNWRVSEWRSTSLTRSKQPEQRSTEQVAFKTASDHLHFKHFCRNKEQKQSELITVILK